MKFWVRLLSICAIPALSLLFATQGQPGRVGELPLWYWVILALLAALSLGQAAWQALQGRARGIAFGSWFGVFIFLLNLSGQALKPQPHWGSPLALGISMGLFMGWVYSYGGAKRSGLERRKQG